jgi:hypothetical protein
MAAPAPGPSDAPSAAEHSATCPCAACVSWRPVVAEILGRVAADKASPWALCDAPLFLQHLAGRIWALLRPLVGDVEARAVQRGARQLAEQIAAEQAKTAQLQRLVDTLQLQLSSTTISTTDSGSAAGAACRSSLHQPSGSFDPQPAQPDPVQVSAAGHKKTRRSGRGGTRGQGRRGGRPSEGGDQAASMASAAPPAPSPPSSPPPSTSSQQQRPQGAGRHQRGAPRPALSPAAARAIAAVSSAAIRALSGQPAVTLPAHTATSRRKPVEAAGQAAPRSSG